MGFNSAFKGLKHEEIGTVNADEMNKQNITLQSSHSL
jgi:hypothetical protein